jgi:hypothetical protein
MRARHIVAVAALVVVGLMVKQFLVPPTKADAQIPPVSMNIMQMHEDYPNMLQMKVDQMHDMQTVFTPQEE